MNCELIQNRLLALHAGESMPADLQGHLKGCTLCQQYVRRLDELASELANLPAPSSETAKMMFLDSLTAAGPVIKTVPTIPSHTSGTWLALRARLDRRMVSGLAAALVVGAASVWWLTRPPRTIDSRDYAQGPRHELLQKIVNFDTRLAQIDSPRQRIPVLTEMASALTDETSDVYKAAQTPDDVRSLTGMFDKVVKQGIIKQAGQYPRFAPVTERRDVLTQAADQLATMANRASEMARSAPPQVKTSLEEMATTARNGQVELIQLREGR